MGRTILTSSFFFPSVTDHFLHAAVSSVCNAQPGRLHPLLPECSAGQLSGRLSTGETKWTSTTQGHQTDLCHHDKVLHKDAKMTENYLSKVQIFLIQNKNKRQKEAKLGFRCGPCLTLNDNNSGLHCSIIFWHILGFKWLINSILSYKVCDSCLLLSPSDSSSWTSAHGRLTGSTSILNRLIHHQELSHHQK